MQFPTTSNLLKVLAYFDPESTTLDMVQTGTSAISKSGVTVVYPVQEVFLVRDNEEPDSRNAQGRATNRTTREDANLIPEDEVPVDLILSPPRRTQHEERFGWRLRLSRPLRGSRGVVRPIVAHARAAAWV
jgi:hypothetical protein